MSEKADIVAQRMFPIMGGAALERAAVARPLYEWHEDMGDVLWWFFPIKEAPYIGSPLDTNWPGYHTHWTPIVMPCLSPPGQSPAPAGNAESEVLRKRVFALWNALAFAASVIKSGEGWTPTCERIIGAALASAQQKGSE